MLEVINDDCPQSYCTITDRSIWRFANVKWASILAKETCKGYFYNPFTMLWICLCFGGLLPFIMLFIINKVFI